MNKEAVKMLKEVGVWKRFIVMMILRSPFDILNSVLTANLMCSFIRIIEKEDKEKLAGNAFLYLLFTILLFAYNMIIWQGISAKTTILLQKGLRKKVFSKILELPPEELKGKKGADWISRLNSDIDKACGYLTLPINYMHMVIAFVNLVISSVIMAFLNIELYLIGIVVALVAFAINVLFVSNPIGKYKEDARKSLVEYTSLIEVSTKDRDIITMFEGENFLRNRIEEKSKEIFRENMKAHNRSSLGNMFFAFSGMFGYLMILVRGDAIMGKNMEDFAQLCKMTQYRSRSAMSLGCIYNCVNNMKGNLVGVKRVNEVILQEK